MPPGKFFRGLIVDDVGFFQTVKQSRKRSEIERLARIDDEYGDAGLSAKLSKRQRNVTEATLWGTETQGKRGWSSDPRPFILRLVWLTCKLASWDAAGSQRWVCCDLFSACGPTC